MNASGARTLGTRGPATTNSKVMLSLALVYRNSTFIEADRLVMASEVHLTIRYFSRADEDINYRRPQGCFSGATKEAVMLLGECAPC